MQAYWNFSLIAMLYTMLADAFEFSVCDTGKYHLFFTVMQDITVILILNVKLSLYNLYA